MYERFLGMSVFVSSSSSSSSSCETSTSTTSTSTSETASEDVLDIGRAVADFNKDGFVEVKGIVDLSELEYFYTKAMDNYDEVRDMIAKKGRRFEIGIKTGFKEIVQRHPFRFEMTYKMDVIFDKLLHPSIFEIAKKILLTDDIDIINKSLVVSLPGSEDQGWHIDGPHMSVETYFPCHCFNVFIPLIDILPEHGPTEFRPGSQELTRDMKKLFIPKLLTKKLRPISGPCLKKGSLLLFDYRVLHRGKANRSIERRPIVVFTFARKGSRDVLNFPRRSVHDEVDTIDSDAMATDEESPSSIELQVGMGTRGGGGGDGGNRSASDP